MAGKLTEGKNIVLLHNYDGRNGFRSRHLEYRQLDIITRKLRSQWISV